MSTTQQQLRSLTAQRRGAIVPGAFNAMSARWWPTWASKPFMLTRRWRDQYVVWPARPRLYGPDRYRRPHRPASAKLVDVPLIVDADTGFGNAVNTYHAVRILERAGADCIQLEDQVSPKRCGHFNGKASD